MKKNFLFIFSMFIAFPSDGWCEFINPFEERGGGDNLPPVHKIIISGKKEAFLDCLEKGLLNVNIKSPTGHTPLMTAILTNNLEMAEALIHDENVDLNLQDDEGNTALIWAVRKLQAGLAAMLLRDMRCDAEILSFSKKSAYTWAKNINDSDMLKVFLKYQKRSSIGDVEEFIRQIKKSTDSEAGTAFDSETFQIILNGEDADNSEKEEFKKSKHCCAIL